MDQIFYLGANGQDYRTPEDAVKYGGGLTHTRTVRGAEIHTVETPAEVTQAEEKTEETPKTKGFMDMSLDELREIAKEKGIKSWHLKKKEKLVDELGKI